MLAVNQCREAFWIGNLKNRDLRGKEIVSQQSSRDENEEEHDEEEQDEEDNEEGQKVGIKIQGVNRGLAIYVIVQLQ